MILRWRANNQEILVTALERRLGGSIRTAQRRVCAQPSRDHLGKTLGIAKL
jgi:hypothetical protein